MLEYRGLRLADLFKYAAAFDSLTFSSTARSHPDLAPADLFKYRRPRPDLAPADLFKYRPGVVVTLENSIFNEISHLG